MHSGPRSTAGRPSPTWTARRGDSRCTSLQPGSYRASTVGL